MQRLGEMVSCRVWLEDKGLGDAWHLDRLQLVHYPSRRTWDFVCQAWVPTGRSAADGMVLYAKVRGGNTCPWFVFSFVRV